MTQQQHAANQASASVRPAATGSKFDERQIQKICALCRLQETEEHLLPSVWKELQTAKDTKDAKTALASWFDHLSDEFMEIHWHKELVEDLRHSRFAPALFAEHHNCHRGIAPMALAPRTDEDRAAIDRNKEAGEAVACLSVGDAKATRTGPPSAPKTFLSFKEATNVHAVFLRELFGPQCPHCQQTNKLRIAFRHRHRRHKGLGAVSIKCCMWSVVEDAQDCFAKCLTAADIAKGCFPDSALALTVTQLLQQQHCCHGALPKQRNAKERGQEEAVASTTLAASQATPSTQRTQRMKPRDDMHPALRKMMKPTETANTQATLGKTLRSAGLASATALPQPANNSPICFRCVFGLRKNTACPLKAGHKKNKGTTEAHAQKLISALSAAVVEASNNSSS